MNCCQCCCKEEKEVVSNYDYIKVASLNGLAELLTDLVVDVLNNPEWYRENIGLVENSLMRSWLRADQFDTVGKMNI